MSARFPGFIALVLATQALAQAPAAAWSFSPGAVSSYVDENGRSLLVAAAGRGTEARSAADALTAALRQDGRAKLVMGDEALGPLGGLSDEQVLAKAKSTVADLFLVVRVFANSTGQPATAVATYCGPFCRPSIFKPWTPIAASAGTAFAPARSFGLRR